MAVGIRSRGTNIFVYVLLGLLIFGLAGFGIGNFGGSVRSVGAVGDTEITVDEYARALQQDLRRFQEQTGQPVTLAQARNFGLDRAVLQRLVAQAALSDEAQRLGLSVSDEVVREEIVKTDAFRGMNGQFDRDSYRFALSQSGLKPAEFEELIRRDVTRALLRQAVVAGVRVPDSYSRALVDYYAEKRDFTWASLDAAGLEAPVADPTEEELRAYYDANPDRYTLPEARRLTYVWLTPEMLAADMQVDDETLRGIYDQRSDEYSKPPRRMVERLVFADMEAAEAARASIAAGETTFDAIVEERGLQMADVDLGEVSADDLPEEVATAVFALEEPGVAGPAESDLGPALYRVNAILAAQNTPFEDVRETLRSEYAMAEAEREMGTIMAQIDDLLAGGATLEDVAKETALELGRIDLRPDSEDPVAAYDEFRAAAAQAEPGDFPELRELSDGGVFALRLEEIIPPTLQEFDSVRDQVQETLRAERTLEALRSQAEAVTGGLGAEDGFAAAGLDARTETGRTRDEPVAGAPQALIAKVFDMQEGEVATVEGTNTLYILRLDAVTPPAPEDSENAQMLALVRQQSSQGIADDLLAAYTRALQNSAGIELNQSAINSVNSQFP